MTIIEYKGAMNSTVQFESGDIVYNIQYDNFKKGKVKNPYKKDIYNVACIGNTRNIKDKDLKYIYDGWHNMIERCYTQQQNYQSYQKENCSVCDEWLCFENYYYWYKENHYTINDEIICLDKDILCHNLKLKDKIYSPETCLFVPQRINMLFIKNNHNRIDSSLPIGVRETQYHTYVSTCRDINNKQVRRYFKTVEEAFNFYKEQKEKLIKQFADKYKTKIPQKLYNALYNYKVEITE